VCPFLIIGFQVLIQIGQHVFNTLVKLEPTLISEVLIEQRLVKPFNDAVVLGVPNGGCPIFDFFGL